MIAVKINTDIYMEVEDLPQGEAACTLLKNGLLAQLEDFPAGEPIGVNVLHFTEVKQEELEERGYVE